MILYNAFVARLLHVLKDMNALTHRRQTDKLANDRVILFAEGDDNDGYGEHIWQLITDLPGVTDELIKWAAIYYDVGAEEAEELVNPARIVGSAGAWDDDQFVSDLWQAMEYSEIETVAGYRTNDGAVVIDREGVEIEKIA